jgi:hypothetical protein
VGVERCDADVLDAFDAWRRAVGIAGDARQPTTECEGEPVEEAQRGHGSLPAHLERVIARLTTMRAGSERELDAVLEATVRELDGYHAKAKTLRGETRRLCIDRLKHLDTELLSAARRQCDAATLHTLGAEADEELAPFRDRLPSQALATARQAALDRLIRERLRLPVVSFE